MQILGTVQGDCNPLDRLMFGEIVTPLTLPDGDCNPKDLQSPSGHIYTPLGCTILHVIYSFLLPEYLTSSPQRPISPTQLFVLSVFVSWRLKSFDTLSMYKTIKLCNYGPEPGEICHDQLSLYCLLYLAYRCSV